MGLAHVVYASRPFGFDDGTLFQILGTAREKNARDGITGSLICRADLYLQLLEGPEAEVEATFERITKDDRHVDVTRLLTSPIKERKFASWAMRHDPAKSWMWSQAEVADGAVMRAGADEIMAVFKRIADEVPAPQGKCPHH